MYVYVCVEGVSVTQLGNIRVELLNKDIHEIGILLKYGYPSNHDSLCGPKFECCVHFDSDASLFGTLSCPKGVQNRDVRLYIRIV